MRFIGVALGALAEVAIYTGLFIMFCVFVWYGTWMTIVIIKDVLGDFAWIALGFFITLWVLVTVGRYYEENKP